MIGTGARPSISSFIYPGIIVAALGLFGYLKYKPTLSTVRPSESAPAVERPEPNRDSDYTAYTRLWEDPLGAAYRMLRDGEQKGNEQEGKKSPPKILSDIDRALILPVMLKGGPNPVDRERRMRTRYAVISALTTANYRPGCSRRMKHVRVSLCSGDKIWVPYELYSADVVDPLYDQYESPSFKRVLVLWIDGDYLGKRPFHSLRDVFAFVLPSKAKEKKHEADASETTAVPVHVIGPSDTDSLLCLARQWCDEMDRLPQWMFEQAPVKLVRDICPKPLPARLTLRFFSPRATIEPAMLKYDDEMTGFEAEVCMKRFTGRQTRGLDPPEDKLEVPGFTPVIGTDWHLVHAIRDELAVRGCWPRSFQENTCIVLLTEMDTLYGRSLPFLMSQLYGRPSNIVDLEVDDLPQEDESRWRTTFRILNPKESGDGEESKGRHSFPSFLREAPARFVASWDKTQFDGTITQQGRTIIVKGAPSNNAPSTENADASQAGKENYSVFPDSDGWLRWRVRYQESGRRHFGSLAYHPKWKKARMSFSVPVVEFKYLRGLDGRPFDARRANGESDEQAESVEDPLVLEKLGGHVPTGNSQLDYLRRLEGELACLDTQLRRAGGKGILSIGVVGTDVYDKLLILRAMRERFPSIPFFTTDLDAEYGRPSELPYTQNLIVASHFGRALHPSLQRNVPPFRDSYQTATFLATLLAVGDGRARRIAEVFRPKPGKQDFWPVPRVAPWDENRSGSNSRPPLEWLEESPYSVTQLRGKQDEEEPDSGKQAAGRGRAEYLQPLVFEIGRNGPYQLTQTRVLTDGRRTDWPSLPNNAEFVTPKKTLTALIQPPGPRDVRSCTVRTISFMTIAVLLFAVLAGWALSPVRRELARLLEALVFIPRAVWHAFRLCARCAVWRRLPAAFPTADRHPRHRRLRLCVCLGWWKSGLNRPWFGFLFGYDRDKGRPQVFWSSLFVLGGLTLVALLVWWIDYSHRSPTGEPFEWLEGVSVWPSTLIRAVGAILGVIFLVIAMGRLKENDRELFKHGNSGAHENDGEPRPNESGWWTRLLRRWKAFHCKDAWRWLSRTWRDVAVYNWKSPRSEEEAEPPNRIAETYVDKGRWRKTLTRTFFIFSVYYAFCLMLFRVTCFPNNPARDGVSRAIALLVLHLCVVVCVFLVFYTIDVIRLCARFVDNLRYARGRWPQELVKSLSPSARESDVDEPDELHELATIRLVAVRTRVVGKFVVFPFILLLLLIVARHRVFDGWNVPALLAMIILLLFLLLILHYLYLRRNAVDLRRIVLRRLNDMLSRQLAAEGQQDQAELTRQIIGEVQTENRGAFGPLSEDYIIRALAVPFGGVGALVLLQQWFPSLS